MTRMAWDDPSVAVASDSARTAAYRRLQSWYREVQLGVTEAGVGANGKPVGSMLPKEAARRQPDLNFLVPAAHAHAELRIREVQAEGGTLEEDRLRRNLLSSMPLCFNLFGAVGERPGFLELIRRLVDPEAVEVVGVVCEWAPRPASRYLGDRSAFDALVTYDVPGGKRRFLGVETKYIEPFSAVAYQRDEYRRVAEQCGWFRHDTTTALSAAATNQLFRTLLLAAACEGDPGFDHGEVLLLTLEDDTRARRAVAAVRGHLVDQRRLHHLSYEEVVSAATAVRDPFLLGWASRFAHRYLDPTSVGNGRVPDPDGPRVGRELRAPAGPPGPL